MKLTLRMPGRVLRAVAHGDEVTVDVETNGALAGAGDSEVVLAAAGRLAVLPNWRAAYVDGQTLALRKAEFELLLFLAREERRVWTNDELQTECWGYAITVASRTVASTASSLRRELAAAAPDVPWIKNRWGVGYSLLPPEDST